MAWNIFRARKKVKVEPEELKFEPTIFYKPKEVKHRNRFRFNFHFNLPKTFLGILFFLLISGVIYIIYQFVRNPYFELKEYKVLGNRNITIDQIKSSFSAYQGRHLYLIDTDGLERQLLTEYPIIDGVDITKIWPDKLFIKISEREPKLVYINLNGGYLVDDQGQILQVVTTNKVDFDQEKIRIARGYGRVEDEYVKVTLQNEFLAKMGYLDKTEEEKKVILLEQFVFETYPLQEKKRVLNELEVLFKAEAESFWNANSKAVALSKYATFPQVRVLNNDILKPDDEVDLDRLTLTLEVTNFLSQRNIPIVSIVWEGELLVKVESLEKRIIVFGLGRKSSLQFEDLLLVTNDLANRGQSYSIIDVSATKVLVVH